jgi:hypothetical protein
MERTSLTFFKKCETNLPFFKESPDLFKKDPKILKFFQFQKLLRNDYLKVYPTTSDYFRKQTGNYRLGELLSPNFDSSNLTSGENDQSNSHKQNN